MNYFVPNTKTTIDAHYSFQPTPTWIPNKRGLHTFLVCGKVIHHSQPVLFYNRPMSNIIIRKFDHDTQQADHLTNYEMGQVMGGN